MGRHGEQASPQENQIINPLDQVGLVGVQIIDTDLLQQRDAGTQEPLSIVNGSERVPLPPGMLLLDGPSEITRQPRTGSSEVEPQKQQNVLGYVRQNGEPYLFRAEDIGKDGKPELPRVVRKRLIKLSDMSSGKHAATDENSITQEDTWRDQYPERVIVTDDLEKINTLQAEERARETERAKELHAEEQRRARIADHRASNAHHRILARAEQIAGHREATRKRVDQQHRVAAQLPAELAVLMSMGSSDNSEFQQRVLEHARKNYVHNHPLRTARRFRKTGRYE
jgi:hypothetical protein